MGILYFLTLGTLIATQIHTVGMQWWAQVDRPAHPHITSNRERLLLIRRHMNISTVRSAWRVRGEGRKVNNPGAAVLRMEEPAELKSNLPSLRRLGPTQKHGHQIKVMLESEGCHSGLVSKKSKYILPLSPSLGASNKALATPRTNRPRPAQHSRSPGGFC